MLEKKGNHAFQYMTECIIFFSVSIIYFCMLINVMYGMVVITQLSQFAIS